MNTEEEKINILPTFRRALSAIGMLELSNVQADLTICLPSNCPHTKTSFRITVFDSSHDNTAFHFSAHDSQEDANNRLSAAIDVIRTDNFGMIKKLSKEIFI